MSPTGLEDLYREIILDHYRNPRNRGDLPSPPATRAEGFNPLCGDEVVVYVDIDDSGRVNDVKVSGQGCSISQSSASMMSEAVKGKTRDDARQVIKSFRSMISVHEHRLDGEGDGDDTEGTPGVNGAAALGDLAALQGVIKFPVRIRCATLSWNTLEQALAESEGR